MALRRKIGARVFVGLLSLFAAAITLFISSRFGSTSIWSSFLSNISAGFVGAGLTYLIIDSLLFRERRSEESRIRLMGIREIAGYSGSCIDNLAELIPYDRASYRKHLVDEGFLNLKKGYLKTSKLLQGYNANFDDQFIVLLTSLFGQLERCVNRYTDTLPNDVRSELHALLLALEEYLKAHEISKHSRKDWERECFTRCASLSVSLHNLCMDAQPTPKSSDFL